MSDKQLILEVLINMRSLLESIQRLWDAVVIERTRDVRFFRQIKKDNLEKLSFRAFD